MGDDMDWTVELEVSLFHAMRRHKPVGIPKHFHMTCIQEKLNSSIQRSISTKQIWKHLSTMYDLQALDNSETVPFPNKTTEFSLPKDEFAGLLVGDFPRTIGPGQSPLASIPVETASKDVKDRDRHGSGSSTRSGSKAEKQRLSSLEDKPEETPKRDGRKRTRHSLQGPATEAPGSTNKRQRRT